MCCYLCTGMVKYANHSTVCLDVLTVLRPMTCANGMMEETQYFVFTKILRAKKYHRDMGEPEGVF